jgi:uncharacterized damage-inducible protein DinB
MPATLSLRELLDYTAGETARWEAWFRAQPDPAAALAVSMGEGRMDTVGVLVHHIFAVERRYAERLLGEPLTEFIPIPDPGLEVLFALQREARAGLERYLKEANEASLGESLSFETQRSGPVTASRRKIVGHALLHGVRHWAQIATALRQAGHAGQWPHDLLLSDALD